MSDKRGRRRRHAWVSAWPRPWSCTSASAGRTSLKSACKRNGLGRPSRSRAAMSYFCSRCTADSQCSLGGILDGQGAGLHILLRTPLKSTHLSKSRGAAKVRPLEDGDVHKN
eukprot:1556935-Amphidinium_carterae.1